MSTSWLDESKVPAEYELIAVSAGVTQALARRRSRDPRFPNMWEYVILEMGYADDGPDEDGELYEVFGSPDHSLGVAMARFAEQIEGGLA